MEISNNYITKDVAKTFEVFLNKTPLSTFIPKSDKELKEDKFERKYGMLYTGAAVVAGAGIFFMLLKGGKFSALSKFIQKHYTELSAKTAEAKTNLQNLDILQRTKYKISEGFVNMVKRSEALGNVNPIKDIAFDRFTQFLHIKPMFDAITRFFTKLSKNLTLKKYNAPRKSLINFKQELQKTIEFIRKSNKPGAEQIAQKLEELSRVSSTEMGHIVNGFTQRFENVLTALNKPVQILKNNKIITRTNIENKFMQEPLENLLAGFIPRKTIYPLKKELFSGLIASKQKLSNSVVDVSKTLYSSVDDIFRNAPMEKSNIRKSYFTLKELIEKFENPKKFNILHRVEVKEKLMTALQNAASCFPEKSPQIDMLKDLQKLLSSDSKGAIEEIISLCKKFGLKEINPEAYKQLISKRDKFQNTLSEAVKFETESTFGKLLDYSLHSLPTDMMTQGVGAGTLLYILLNNKNSKDEKISSTLKNGIPILGGLGVMFACNVRQVASGPAALFLGILSTVILNRLGKVADKKYLASKAKLQPQNQPQIPLTAIAKNEAVQK